ncbi:hypothetical protein V8G54_014610 [Vigna mungo]|uniref:Ribosome biogenesis regulatory protein n=1 Tax=Vigna mungo TaxID=3915 RepID=A0AAQ3NGY7_VIGMU
MWTLDTSWLLTPIKPSPLNHLFPGTIFLLLLLLLLLQGFFVISEFDSALLTLIEHREDLVKQCLLKGTHLVQAIADALFTLPSTEDVDGPLVNLPPPLTKLPREKHVIPHSYSSFKSKGYKI